MGGSGTGGNDLTATLLQPSRASHSPTQGGHCVLVISIDVAHEDLLCARTCPRCLDPCPYGACGPRGETTHDDNKP